MEFKPTTSPEKPSDTLPNSERPQKKQRGFLEKWFNRRKQLVERSQQGKEQTKEQIPPEEKEETRAKRLAHNVLRLLSFTAPPESQKTSQPEQAPAEQNSEQLLVTSLRRIGQKVLGLVENVRHEVQQTPVDKTKPVIETAPLDRAETDLRDALTELDDAIVDAKPPAEFDGPDGEEPSELESGGDGGDRNAAQVEKIWRVTEVAQRAESAERKAKTAIVVSVGALALATVIGVKHHRLKKRERRFEHAQKQTEQKIVEQNATIRQQKAELARVEHVPSERVSPVTRQAYVEQVADLAAKQAVVTHEVASQIRDERVAKVETNQIPSNVEIPSTERISPATKRASEETLEFTPQPTARVERADRIERNVPGQDTQAGEQRGGGATVDSGSRASLPAPKLAVDDKKSTPSPTNASIQTILHNPFAWLYGAVLLATLIAVTVLLLLFG